MNDIETKCRRTWRSMMNRCYQSEASLLANRNPSYRNCKVCDKWHEYENFREWYMKNYINGYTLDKDLFKNGTPIYSPSTCCFLPPPINILLITKQRKNSNLPTGVSLDKSGQFQCIVKTNGRPMRIGTFSRISEAYEAYVKYKNNYIHCTAKEYFQRGEINERIYKALSTYEIPREEFVDEFHPKTNLADPKKIASFKNGRLCSVFDCINDAARYLIRQGLFCSSVKSVHNVLRKSFSVS